MNPTRMNVSLSRTYNKECCHILKLNIEPRPPSKMSAEQNITPAYITPAVIRRRMNDYDAQVREGIENGDIRAVLRRIGPAMVSRSLSSFHMTDSFFFQSSLLALSSKGTPEQMRAFPQHLFVFQFLRAWTKDHRDPELLDKQVALLEAYDRNPPQPEPQTPPALPETTPPPPPVKAPLPAPLPAPVKTAPSTPPPQPRPQPRPRPRAEVRAAPLPALIDTINPDPLPPRAPVAMARSATASGSGTAQLPAQPRVVESMEPKKVVNVVMPPRPPRNFKAIEADTDADSEDHPATIQRMEIVGLYDPPCIKCANGKRDCYVEETGTACTGCKEKKYRCSLAKEAGATIRKVRRMVTVAADDDEVEIVAEGKGGKGKEKAGGSVVYVKREKRTREEEEEPKEKPKPKPRPRAKPKAAPAAKKGKAKAKTPEGAELDDDPMEIEVGSEEERQPKRSRRLPGKCLHVPIPLQANLRLDWTYEQMQQEKRIAVLEAQVSAFNRVAEQTTRTSQRLDSMQDQVFRFTGALENVLSRIYLDDRRLVPAPMRIDDVAPSPSALVAPATKSTTHSPSASGLAPMEEDETDSAVGSLNFPGTQTTESDSPEDVRMAEVGPASLTVPSIPNLPIESPDAEGVADPTPDLNVIPATPQGSQTTEAALAPPDIPLRPNTRSRSVSKEPN